MQGMKPQADQSPTDMITNMYKHVNLPLLEQRLFGEIAGKDTPIYGRVWTYLEGSLTFAATAFQALAFLVKDIALTALALIPAIISSDARRFVEVHVAHMLQDLVAIPVGIVGFVSPHIGTFLAKSAINVFISLFQDGTVDEKGESEVTKFKAINGEFVEGLGTSIHLGSTLLAFMEREDALKAKGEALAENPDKLDTEKLTAAMKAIQEEDAALKEDMTAWVADNTDGIASAAKGPLNAMFKSL